MSFDEFVDAVNRAGWRSTCDAQHEGIADLWTELSKRETTLYAELTRLRAELAEARKDAERYRWLRHGDNDEVVMQRGMTYSWLPRNERLDAIIDAAIAKEQP